MASISAIYHNTAMAIDCSYNISWNSNSVTNVNIDLSYNTGTLSIATNITASDKNIFWRVPSNIANTIGDIKTVNSYIKISDSTNSSTSDVSLFPIRFHRKVIKLHPNSDRLETRIKEFSPKFYKLHQNYSGNIRTHQRSTWSNLSIRLMDGKILIVFYETDDSTKNQCTVLGKLYNQDMTDYSGNQFEIHKFTHTTIPSTTNKYPTIMDMLQVKPLKKGGFVVCFQEDGNDTCTGNIYLRYYNINYVASPIITVVPPSTSDSSLSNAKGIRLSSSSLCSTRDGGFLIVYGKWGSYSKYCQKFPYSQNATNTTPTKTVTIDDVTDTDSDVLSFSSDNDDKFCPGALELPNSNIMFFWVN